MTTDTTVTTEHGESTEKANDTLAPIENKGKAYHLLVLTLNNPSHPLFEY